MKFLAMWRFAPECKENLGQLWQLLPADTRVPDHSIWNHLDLTSAFAGARFDNKKVSILSMAFGPVQSFIAQAKKTSDLWAGSHLLSSIVWEGMTVIADEIGPDAFLFPQIRGLAIVDAWLLEKARIEGLEQEWREAFESFKVEWLKNKTDSNPLFAACLPNKFSAIVPTDKAEELAERIKKRVRNTVKQWVIKALEELNLSESVVANEQVQKQLEEFPQVYMSAVEWTDSVDDKSDNLKKLREAYDIFSVESENFFEKNYWKCLSKDIVLNGFKFWNHLSSGVIYPAVYELSEKSLASAKSLRAFKQLPQNGFRCTLCGEREWLTDNKDKLLNSPGSRVDTVWAKLPNTGKKPEHLCAICTLKRFWPKIFAERVKDYIDKDNIRRYVISTHTMSLIPTLRKLNGISKQLDGMGKLLKLDNTMRNCESFDETTVLPKKMFVECENSREICKRIPAYIDFLRETDDLVKLESFQMQLKEISGSKPETYYALILMDGDNMGTWLSASEEERRIPYSKSWHPRISENEEFLRARNENIDLKNYLETLKTASPTRHATISQALNNFSSKIVPDIIENRHSGKLIYSGGDDVLAMASTDEVIDIIKELRMAYSGFGKALLTRGEQFDSKTMYKQNGFVYTNRKLMQVMGTKASTSVGVVIVHHQTPLAYALKCLHEAEHIAKDAGRNAFCIRILKRAGGEITFMDNWWNEKECPSDVKENGLNNLTSIGLFESLFKALAQNDDMSRRAFYSLEEWIRLLPDWPDSHNKNIAKTWSEDDWLRSEEMASAMLARQFEQHGAKETYMPIRAEELVKFIWNKAKREQNEHLKNPVKQLEGMLYCAEFFARETRSFNKEAKNE